MSALSHHATPAPATGYTPIGVHFNGVDDYIAVPDAAAFNNLTSFTLSSWIHIDSLDSGGNECFFGRWTRNYGYPFDLNERCWYLKRDYPTANYPSFLLVNGTTIVSISSTTPITATGWHHVVGIRDTGSDKAIIYVNNNKTEAAGSNGTNAMDKTAGIQIGHSTIVSSLAFGPGCVKDCRIWSRALSDAEVAAVYAGGDISSGLVAHWPLHEGTGTVAADVVGGNNGTLTNSPNWSCA